MEHPSALYQNFTGKEITTNIIHSRTLFFLTERGGRTGIIRYRPRDVFLVRTERSEFRKAILSHL